MKKFLLLLLVSVPCYAETLPTNDITKTVNYHGDGKSYIDHQEQHCSDVNVSFFYDDRIKIEVKCDFHSGYVLGKQSFKNSGLIFITDTNIVNDNLESSKGLCTVDTKNNSVSCIGVNFHDQEFRFQVRNF